MRTMAVFGFLIVLGASHGPAQAPAELSREEMRGLLNRIEFNEGLTQMVAQPDMARDILREELRRPLDDRRARRCLIVLGRIGEPADAFRSLRFLRSTNDVLRLDALRVITRFGDESTAAAVEMCLYDENPAVRSTAMDGLVGRKSDQARAALSRFLAFAPSDGAMKADQDKVRSLLATDKAPVRENKR